ncbi:MAG TPA: N-acetylmuramoyl-L-alanine amidase [Thermoanaerobaculia bacterium]|nr:N-acetylmuramoyl-L-alanine amidase [Thermoanaerobaculia bacterium]
MPASRAARRAAAWRRCAAGLLVGCALLADPLSGTSRGHRRHRAAGAKARSHAAATGAKSRSQASGTGAKAPGAAPARNLRGAVEVAMEKGVVAVLSGDGEIHLTALPRRGEALAAFAQRLCGDARLAPQVKEANHGAKLATGRPYQVPYDILAPDWQLKVAHKLFPDDRGEAVGWRHRVRGVGSLRRENLWSLATWFTGKGENFAAIRDHNGLHDEDVAPGTVLTIPSELLRPAFGAALPVPEKTFQLAYGKDQEGEYAVYRLRPGEALYSGVVVRFTGRIYAADVNALAAEIARRSGIEDVTDIPIGFRVKIPIEYVQPEFLPEGDPRRKEYEAGLRASAQFSNQVRAKGLAGITVILDPGHGGHDSGATVAGVWESLYVYDIALRIKRSLESSTAAAVHITTRDGEEFHVEEADLLPPSRRHSVLTTPPYPIEDSTVGVNLRWYLANSVFRRALQADNDPQKVVFLSIHADSLHPALRGAMAYIPPARMRGDSYGKDGPVYAQRKEFQESPRVTFARHQRVESEGLSRELAKQVIGAFQELDLPVHPFNPVRDHIIRNRSEWVPAVLRYNTVPAKLLLEVCNLNNSFDRRLLQTRSYREKVAEAVVAGLLAYYGQSASPSAERVAKAGR